MVPVGAEPGAPLTTAVSWILPVGPSATLAETVVVVLVATFVTVTHSGVLT